MHKEILIIIFSLLIISCSKETNPVIGDLNESFLSGKGVFILNGIRRMNIDAIQLPAEIFIPDPEYSFYKMGVNPDNGEIFVTDAVDYIQKGNIIRYSKEGALISEMQADIIPGGLCFKVNSESDTE